MVDDESDCHHRQSSLTSELTTPMFRTLSNLLLRV